MKQNTLIWKIKDVYYRMIYKLIKRESVDLFRKKFYKYKLFRECIFYLLLYILFILFTYTFLNQNIEKRTALRRNASCCKYNI